MMMLTRRSIYAWCMAGEEQASKQSSTGQLLKRVTVKLPEVNLAANNSVVY